MSDMRPFQAVRRERGNGDTAAAFSYEELKAQAASKEWTKPGDAGYYVYELTNKAGAVQTCLVACASVDDYLNEIIKNHGYFEEEQEEDVIRQIEELQVQANPAVIAYRNSCYINQMMDTQKENDPSYVFQTPEGTLHKVWVVDDYSKVANFQDALNGIDDFYMIDGYEYAASAVQVALERRCLKGNDGEEFNYFVCALVSYDEFKKAGADTKLRIASGVLSHQI